MFLPVIIGISFVMLLPGVAAAIRCLSRRRYAAAALCLAVPIPAAWIAYGPILDVGVYGYPVFVLMFSAATAAVVAVLRLGPQK